MVFNEISLGPLYLVVVSTNRRFVPLHLARVHEMVKPFRRGTALVVPIWFWKAIFFGLWWRSIEKDFEEDFKDDLWFDPCWMDVTAEEISKWSRGDDDITD